MIVRIKKYLKWFPICGIALTSLEEERELKIFGVIYMVYQFLCCILWLLIISAYITSLHFQK